MKISKEQIKRVYALGAGLGLVDNRNHDGDMLHELVHGITGKTSIAELTVTEFNAVQRELLERMRLKNQVPPPSRKKKPLQEAPAADMMTAEQQSLAWRLVYRLEELDKEPKLHEDGTAVSVGERMSGAINKVLDITPNMKEPFRWVTFADGVKLIETLKRYVVSAEKKGWCWLMDNQAIDKITFDDLYGEQKELAETIGLEAYKKLVKTYGGLSVYVAKADYVIRNDRDGRIIQEYTGYNAKALAAKYDLAERSILRIVAPETERLKNEPIAEQMSFCDY